MSTFDPELHLRLLGERGLLDRAASRHPLVELTAVATTLVVLCGLDQQVAERAVDDYALALWARTGRPLMRLVRRTSDRHALDVHTVVRLDGRVDVDGCPAYAQAALLGKRTTEVRLVVPYEAAAQLKISLEARRGRQSIVTRTSTVSDDGGRSVVLSLGAVDARRRDCLVTFRGPGGLSVTTRWLDVDGARVDVGPVPRASAAVEPVPPRDALGYLWHVAATMVGPGQSPLPAVVDALAAASLLDPEDEAIMAVDALVQHWSVDSALHHHLPLELRSILREAHQHAGPIGSVLFDAPTVTVDGETVHVHGLRSVRREFAIELHTTCAGQQLMSGFGEVGAVGTLPLVWWAQDDHGTWYHGRRGESHEGAGDVGGVVDFRPALDPAAAWVRLMPTGLTSRAVIEVPLAWDVLS